MSSHAASARYGLLGAALAFVALPLHVHLPAHYATHHGVPLAALGALLLAVRGLDAVLDPWFGRWADRSLGTPRLLLQLSAAAVLLAAGFAALFAPAVAGTPALLAWAGLCLVACYGAYSLLSITHQAWAARLGGDEAAQTRLVAWREGFALVGVIVASVLPTAAGWGVTSSVLAGALVLGLLVLRSAPTPPVRAEQQQAAPRVAVWGVAAFRRLLAVHLLNGTAAAIPATLLVFFVTDRLQTPQDQGLYLAAYFLAAAASLPLWLRLVAWMGGVRTWQLGMGLAVLAFCSAAVLRPGDGTAFLAICIGSGAALGADLALPTALLAGVVQRAGYGGQAEGAFFGWWHAATKLNLALAAALALPLPQALGYTPGTRDAAGLTALSFTYALLPCVLKLMAVALLHGVRR
ncbi:MFS transporter [Roseateles paludis]|jgi:Na+/melibiose symporter-like transporter|uniref:MFS transporter n=1 Tax=Roseateles paludis TaxID=3145238 RepID=A0ABV0FZ34_9BURK